MLIGNTVTNKKSFFAEETTNVPVYFLPKMSNRHGIIAGQTGVGKTVTLRVFAEEFSKIGVPVFLTDIKGDISSIEERGEKPENRPKDWKPHTFQTKFWDVFGKEGEQIQTSIDELGVLLLSKMLELTSPQSDVLSLIFKLAKDLGKKIKSLDHILEGLAYFGSAGYKLSEKKYGDVPPSSSSGLLRKILALQDQGGDGFFNESSFNLEKMIRTKRDEGIINVLNCIELVKYPKLYATFLIWILTKLYDELPEIGNPDKPKFVLFIDEAHLLFQEIQPNLKAKIERVMRLMRSKGVGIFFVTQNPMDIPDSILEQVGNRVQHGLTAYSAKARRNVKALAESFVTDGTVNIAEAITSMPVGEAIVSFLDETGKPQLAQRVKIKLPQSRI